MRRSNKCLSLLLVTFIVGVNALTACGQIPHTKAETAESAAHSDLSFPFSDHVHVIRAARTSQLKAAVKAEPSQTGKDPVTLFPEGSGKRNTKHNFANIQIEQANRFVNIALDAEKQLVCTTCTILLDIFVHVWAHFLQGV